MLSKYGMKPQFDNKIQNRFKKNIGKFQKSFHQTSDVYLSVINVKITGVNQSGKSAKMTAFFSLLSDFLRLQKLLFPSWKTSSVWCFVSLLVASSMEQFLAYKVGLISGKFYEILGNKNQDLFVSHVIYRQLFYFAVL